MTDAARQLREYLDGQGGHAETIVSRLVGTWDSAARAKHAERLTRDLDEVGVTVEPPLAACGPDTVIRIRVVERSPETEATSAPVPESAAVSGDAETASSVGRSPDPAEVAAPGRRLPRPRRPSLAWPGNAPVPRLPQAMRSRPGRVLATAGAGLVVAIVVVVVSTSGSDAGSGAREDRAEFCTSDAGRQLNDALIVAVNASRRPDTARLGLQSATSAALEQARSAPAGADCAVFALDSLAEAWAQVSDRAIAREHIQRIRSYQRAENLDQAAS